MQNYVGSLSQTIGVFYFILYFMSMGRRGEVCASIAYTMSLFLVCRMRVWN